MQATILIVDDEKNTREGLRRFFEDDYDVYLAADAESALGLLRGERMDVMVTDLRLGGKDGMGLIEEALRLPHPPVCIMMTAYGSVDTAVQAMRRGAYDFVTKPLNMDQLDILIKRALQGKTLERENRELKVQVDKRFGMENFIGSSGRMEEIFDTIRQVAATRVTVLIEGESGTGKELVARALHQLSGRPKEKFTIVHCAALSPQLLESELFGHEKGAFTGAMERRMGRFEQANGGTVFLDEIGEIDLATQVKILRVLGEERSFERVGGNKTIAVDVRLVSATNKSLERLVAEGKFRDDLFFRLNVVRITMPPLRERREDIPLLARAFLREFAKANGKPERELAAEAAARLEEYHWPGNVRELRAALEHGVVMATGAKIALRDLPHTLRQPAAALVRPLQGSEPGVPVLVPGVASPAPSELNLEQTEREMILRALERCRGNRTEAAKALGISRRTLHRRLRDLTIDN